jgi:RNA polymerase sigma factor (sigma-70 family)
MLHHTKPFVEATRGELERFFPASDARGRTKPPALRRLSAQIRAVARAHRVPPHEVEDVVQTTWLRLLEHGDSIREGRALGAWLHTTARRESLRILRGIARTQPTDPAHFLEEHDPEPTLGSRVLTAEVSEALGDAIDALPERQRLVLRMLLREPAPQYTEVSSALGMPIGSIGPTRARALERLRQDARLSALVWEDGLGWL